MLYFCYISEHKVNQIISQIDSEVINETTETREVTQSTNNELGATFFNLFKSKINFGKNTRMLLSHSKRTTLVSNLEVAIKYLYDSQDSMNIIKNDTKELSKISRICYLKTKLRVVSYDDKYAYLEAVELDNIKLKLSCSLKYFSDTYGQTTSSFVHSGNIDFFNGNVFPSFQGLIFIIGTQKDYILASPLYLSLSLNSMLDL